jgi:hypothetical protein
MKYYLCFQYTNNGRIYSTPCGRDYAIRHQQLFEYEYGLIAWIETSDNYEDEQ